ncbi:glycosyltransferase family 4 protein [Patescibacteria group bacterium]|nr:glycosyltransferase family 4 protein [Patescibacteria group bacterium]
MSQHEPIIVFSTAYFPLVGGAEVALREITDRMPDENVHVFTARIRRGLTSRERIGNVEVHRFGVGHPIDKYLLAILAPLAAWRLQRKVKNPVIWSLMASYNGFAALFYTWMRPSARTLLTLQEGDPFEHIEKRVGFFNPFFKKIFRRADAIQAISAYLAEWAVHQGARVVPEVIPNGVDLERFTKPMPTVEREAFRAKLGYLPEDIVLITTGRLIKKNAVDDVVRALSSLPERVKFLSVGEGEDRDGLERLIKERGLEKRVQLHPKCDHEMLVRFLRASDIFIRPSLSEGLGNSFLEAMAAELPIIGTPVGGIADFLHDGETGIFCQPRDPASIVTAVQRLIEDSLLRAKLVQQGLKAAIDSYGWKGIADRMQGILGRLRAPALVLATGIYPPEIGGPATYAALMEEEMRRRGWKVMVLPFRVVRHLPSGVRHLVYAWKLFWLTRGAQAILAQDTVSVGIPALFVARLRSVPLLVRVPGDFAWEQGVQRFDVKESIDAFQTRVYGWRVELLRRLQARVVRGADQVMAPSVYFANLVRGWGVPTERVHAVYNGVAIPEDVLPVRGSRPRIISAGRLVPWKKFDGLIRLLPRLPGVDLFIVGEGPDRASLEALARQEGVAERVTFTGALPRAELLALIAGADLFVLRSQFESFSFQLVEAMMLGAPVIAQSIGNLGEIVQSGENGLLLAPADEDGLFEAIKRLLADPTERARLGKNAQKTSQRFSVTATGDAVEGLLLKISEDRATSV